MPVSVVLSYKNNQYSPNSVFFPLSSQARLALDLVSRQSQLYLRAHETATSVIRHNRDSFGL